jgi:hypothetical protein
MAARSSAPDPWSIYPAATDDDTNKYGLTLAVNAFKRRKKLDEDNLTLGAQAIQGLMKRSPYLMAEQAKREAGEKYQREGREAKEQLQKRVGLHAKLYDAQSIGDDKERAGEISNLKAMGVDDMGIDADIFDKVEGEQQDKFKADKDRDAYWDSKIDSRPLSQRRRKLHTRRDGLRKARMLRKAGFPKAAERQAAAWADSPEGDAPSIAGPAYRAEQADQSARVASARETNKRLHNLLMSRMEKKFQADPDFMPNTSFRI